MGETTTSPVFLAYLVVGAMTAAILLPFLRPVFRKWMGTARASRVRSAISAALLFVFVYIGGSLDKQLSAPFTPEAFFGGQTSLRTAVRLSRRRAVESDAGAWGNDTEIVVYSGVSSAGYPWGVDIPEEAGDNVDVVVTVDSSRHAELSWDDGDDWPARLLLPPCTKPRAEATQPCGVRGGARGWRPPRRRGAAPDSTGGR